MPGIVPSLHIKDLTLEEIRAQILPDTCLRDMLVTFSSSSGYGYRLWHCRGLEDEALQAKDYLLLSQILSDNDGEVDEEDISAVEKAVWGIVGGRIGEYRDYIDGLHQVIYPWQKISHLFISELVVDYRDHFHGVHIPLGYYREIPPDHAERIDPERLLY